MRNISAFFVFVVAACSSAPKTPAQGGTSSGDASHTACSTDADCVVVETECCDECNGGKAVAFNKAHADAHRPTGCEGVPCTARACATPPIASCEAGACKVTSPPM